MPRLVRYNVAMSLDGFIAPPDESTDWIVPDPTIDFTKLYQEFDTFVMGRKTYETMCSLGGDGEKLLFGDPERPRPRENIIVLSRHLKPQDHSRVTILKDGFVERLSKLKSEDAADGKKKDIWVMGGAWLASACMDAGLLDVVEAAIMPVVLRHGFTLFTSPSHLEKHKEAARTTRLRLCGSEQLSQSGIIMTRYEVVYK
ncbi:Dihydrofolate reductase-like domain containing protein [Naviculisporaceae sp. PSN 640]